MRLMNGQPLAHVAPAVTEELPRFAPVDALVVRDERLAFYAVKLGYEQIEIGAYSGRVVDVQVKPFNAIHGDEKTRIKLGRIAPEQPEEDTLALELNVPQIVNWVQHTRRMRDPQSWAKPLDAGLKTGLMDQLDLCRAGKAATRLSKPVAAGLELMLLPWPPLIIEAK